MAKVFKALCEHVLSGKQFTKFFKVHPAGSRIVPSKKKILDETLELRIDAGERVGGRQNVVLQVNNEATNEALKKFRQKNGSHAKLATASIDVDVPEEKRQEEVERALGEMEPQVKEKIG